MSIAELDPADRDDDYPYDYVYIHEESGQLWPVVLGITLLLVSLAAYVLEERYTRPPVIKSSPDVEWSKSMEPTMVLYDSTALWSGVGGNTPINTGSWVSCRFYFRKVRSLCVAASMTNAAIFPIPVNITYSAKDACFSRNPDGSGRLIAEKVVNGMFYVGIPERSMLKEKCGKDSDPSFYMFTEE